MRYLASITALGLLVTPALARADNDSLFTIGLGGSAGFARAAAGQSVATDLRVRVRVLRGLGAELGFHPALASGLPSQGSSVSLSGLLYVVPTFPVGAYLKAGLEAPGLSEMVGFTGADVIYHGGAGVEYALGKHLTVGAELLFVGGVLGVSAGGHTISADAGGFSLHHYRAALELMFYL